MDLDEGRAGILINLILLPKALQFLPIVLMTVTAVLNMA